MRTWQDRFRMIISVYLILEKQNGEVLLLLRQNTGYCDGQYGLPAGHVDGSEELTTAMIREAHEEVGLNLNPDDLKMAHLMHRHCGDHERIDVFFKCQKWQGEPINNEPEKCTEIKWFHLDNFPPNVIDYYKQMFEQIKQGKPYSGFGWSARGLD